MLVLIMTNNLCHYNKINFICLAIIQLYFIRTFSYVLSSVEYNNFVIFFLRQQLYLQKMLLEYCESVS